MTESEHEDQPKKGKKSCKVGHIKMKVIDDLKADTIDSVVDECVSIQAHVRTDDSTTYVGLSNKVEQHISKVIPPKNINKELPWVHIAISNLHKRIIDKVNKIAKQEGIVLRQTYTRTLKQLLIDQRFRSHPKRRKKAKAALRKIKTIAGRQVRDIESQFTQEQKDKYQDLFIILYKILIQKKGNPYDGHTLDEHLIQTEHLTEKRPKIGIVDRGYKGKKNIDGTIIILPSIPKKNSTQYQKQKARKQFRARAGIEPVIGHIKHDHRMLRNYLKGVNGNQLNTILAETGFNLKKMLNRIKKQILFVLFETEIYGKYSCY